MNRYLQGATLVLVMRLALVAALGSAFLAAVLEKHAGWPEAAAAAELTSLVLVVVMILTGFLSLAFACREVLSPSPAPPDRPAWDDGVEASCGACFPGRVEVGRVVPTVGLVFWGDKYHLVWSPGHDVLVTFPVPPRPDSDPESVSDEDDGWIDEVYDAFVTTLPSGREADLPMDAENGARFVANCREAGYDGTSPHRRLICWLYDRCGRMVEAYESAKPKEPPADGDP